MRVSGFVARPDGGIEREIAGGLYTSAGADSLEKQLIDHAGSHDRSYSRRYIAKEVVIQLERDYRLRLVMQREVTVAHARSWPYSVRRYTLGRVDDQRVIGRNL